MGAPTRPASATQAAQAAQAAQEPLGIVPLQGIVPPASEGLPGEGVLPSN